ncbi:hypothetical protein DINM_003046 [Dirofilaria immitis]|nr:hypothetical protein [Dirofilaria immitis]
MKNNKWSSNDDLPPPSMRQNYANAFLPSSQFLSQNDQLNEKDKILAQHQDTPSVSDIEERLAKLRDVSVDDIRYPRFAIVNENRTEEETVQKLIRQAKDEAALEAKWDTSGKSEEHDINPEEFIELCKNNASPSDDLNEELSISNADIMGRDTIRNLKQLQRTMKLAKQQSKEAANLVDTDSNNRSMESEIEELMTLTKQSNKKSAKINEELSKFWEKRLNDEMSSSESSLDNIEINQNELKRIILEAEKTENEAMQMVKESKRSSKKNGIFSRIFRS